MRLNIYPSKIIATSVLICLASAGFAAGKQWYPTEVDVWEPPFNTERKRSTETYVPLVKASKPWNICVSIPHLKDAYWLAVNYGLIDEAKRLGVNIKMYEAGGYERLDMQRKQVEECLEANTDGLILSAISSTELNDLVKKARDKGLPVIDLINGMNSPYITARAAVDFYDTGYQAGKYLIKHSGHASEKIHVAWFPGPEGAGWVAAGDSGFRDALKESSIEIIASQHGDTGKTTQAGLIKAVLDQVDSHSLDYIVGTTVTAEAAEGILRQRGLSKKIKVLSYYYGPGVHKGIKRGSILAAPTDSQAIQARIALDTMVRVLENKPYFKHAAPKVSVIDRKNQRAWDSSTTLAPRGFRPIFSIEQ